MNVTNAVAVLIARRGLLGVLGALLVLAWSLARCEPEVHYPYRIVDSGIKGRGDFVWLDDRRLLVVVLDHPTQSPELEKLIAPARNALVIWDTETGEITPYRPWGSNIYCYSTDTRHIVYATRELRAPWSTAAGKGHVWYGVFGQERPYPLQVWDEMRQVWPDTKFGCELSAPQPPVFPDELARSGYAGHRQILELPEGRGYLLRPDWFADVAHHPELAWATWIYYDAGGKKLRDLPFGGSDLDLGYCCQWVGWQGGYFISKVDRLPPGRPLPQPGETPQIGWMLYPSGQLEEVRVAPHPKLAPAGGPHFGGHFSLSKRGWVFRYWTNDPDWKGVYLIAGDQYVRIAGDLDAGSSLILSPNGCRLAYLAEDRPMRVGRRKVIHPRHKVIDICQSADAAGSK